MNIVAYTKEAFWELKEWYAAAVAVAVPVLNYFCNLGLEQTTVLTLVVIVVSIIIGKEIHDVKVEQAKLYAMYMSLKNE